jgi:Ca2+-binding EF-hand superfamily protein
MEALLLQSEDDSQSVPITPAEEKELRRVYDLLCDYQAKTKLKSDIRDLQANMHMARISAHSNPRIAVNTKELDKEEQRVASEIERKQQQIYALETNPNKKISVGDVCEILKKLKQRAVRKEVEAMVWEVDDDLDQCINWSEFRLMFTRNVMDRTGLEPSKMFNLTQFLIYDHNENGRVSVDETMNMLYARLVVKTYMPHSIYLYAMYKFTKIHIISYHICSFY